MLGNAIADNITIYTLHENNTFFTIQPSIYSCNANNNVYVCQALRAHLVTIAKDIHSHTHTHCTRCATYRGQYKWQVNRLLFICSSYVSRFCCVFTNLISFVSAFPYIYFVVCVCVFLFRFPLRLSLFWQNFPPSLSLRKNASSTYVLSLCNHMNGNLSAVFYTYYCALPNNIHTHTQNGHKGVRVWGRWWWWQSRKNTHTTIQVSEILSYARCMLNVFV